MGITKQEGQENKKIKRVIDIALAVFLALIVIFAVKMIKRDFNKIGQKPKSDDNIISDIDSGDDLGSQPIYVSEAIDNSIVNQGSLILVNEGAEYKWNEDGLKSLLEVRNNDGTDAYSVLDNDVKARGEAAAAMNAMLKAFSSETGHKDIRIDNAYRSVAEQQSIYDNTPGASVPGCSDYHTGYSIDLNVVDKDGEAVDFDGTGDYEWFGKNCYKYGFVLRCPEGKEDITGQSYRPWHFRYVGKPHAAYMFENGLCLEEYIKKLESYPYDGSHLEVTDADSKRYEIYYFAADMSTALTSVAVPSDGEYDISGNNKDGFIITVSLDAPAEQSTEAEPESGDAAETSKKAEE